MFDRQPVPFLYIAIFILYAATAFPQSDSSIIPLEEVTISKYHITDSILNAPVSISILNHSAINSNNSSDISLTLNRVPGLYMQSANFTTNRISIRGIGSRTPYGTNKIRAFYHNIPLTSGNSETTIEDLDLETIGRIEVVKGPLSSIYGAGLAGAIIISPKDPIAGTSISAGTTVGSYGLLKQRLSFSGNYDRQEIDLSYHRLESDGWRQNSSYRRSGFTLGAKIFQSSSSSLHLLANHTYLKAFIPSSVDRATFDTNPRAAATTWLAAKSYKEYSSALAGLSYRTDLSPQVKNETSVFINYRDNYETRPFDILEQFTLAAGARTQFSGTTADKKLAYILGGEYFHDQYLGGTFENLYLTTDGRGSLEGSRMTEAAQKRRHHNIFGQLRWRPAGKFEVQGGVNYNNTSFLLNSRFPVSERSNEKYSYDPIVSPHLSLLYHAKSGSTIYASVSRGFSMPSIDETLDSDGRINTSIVPENGYNTEIGYKSFFWGKRLFTELTAYRMSIRDLLVARRIGDDQYIGVNAGKTLHMGIEFFAEATFTTGQFGIKPFVSGSVGRFRFTKYIDNGQDYSGNKLTGTPASKLTSGITFTYLKKLFIYGELQFTDGFAMNDANTFYSDSYKIVNVKAGYTLDITKSLKAELSTGINNVANEHYASMILVNATAFGGASPRYYYPGLPVNHYSSLSLSYLF
jgi:iron complex outermembrane receptor protein